MDTDGLDASRWRATNAHARAATVGVLGLLLAVVLNRANVFVLAVPFVLIATWGQAKRPNHPLTTKVGMDRSTIREGEPLAVSTDTTNPGADTLVQVPADDPWWRTQNTATPSLTTPSTTTPTDASPGQPAPKGATVRQEQPGRVDQVYRPLRWGQRSGPVPLVYALSPWLAYGATASINGPTSVLVTPLPEAFSTRAPMPHPRGLVGLDRSTRRGSGYELESIHPYQSGDRLRLIHWPTTLRTGTPHVTGTYSDEESHVVLLLDNTTDIGPLHPGPEHPTSLDLTLRAGAALVTHHLTRGDRVTLRTLGRSTIRLPATMTGRSWIEPALAQLAACDRAPTDPASARRTLTSRADSALVIVLSPLLHQDVRDLLAECVLHRLCIVVDTFPRHLGAHGDAATDLAWRITRLQRDTTLDALTERGVPVVPWTGAASLDPVLRAVAHRRRGPHRA